MGFNYEDVVFARWFTFCCDRFKEEEIITRYITPSLQQHKRPEEKQNANPGTFLISMFHQSRAGAGGIYNKWDVFYITASPGKDTAAEIKRDNTEDDVFCEESFIFPSLITLKQISENYDNEFNSVQPPLLPLLPRNKETTRSNCAAFLHFSVIIKVKAVWKVLWTERLWNMIRFTKKKQKHIYKLVTRVLCCGILTVSGCHQDETPTQWGGRGGVVIKRVGWELDFICKRRLQGRSDAKHICASSVHTRVRLFVSRET